MNKIWHWYILQVTIFLPFNINCVRTCISCNLHTHTYIYCTHKDICWNFEVCTYIVVVNGFSTNQHRFDSVHLRMNTQMYSYKSKCMTICDLHVLIWLKFISKINSFLSKNSCIFGNFLLFWSLDRLYLEHNTTNLD